MIRTGKIFLVRIMMTRNPHYLNQICGRKMETHQILQTAKVRMMFLTIH